MGGPIGILRGCLGFGSEGERDELSFVSRYENFFLQRFLVEWDGAIVQLIPRKAIRFLSTAVDPLPNAWMRET